MHTCNWTGPEPNVVNLGQDYRLSDVIIAHNPIFFEATPEVLSHMLIHCSVSTDRYNIPDDRSRTGDIILYMVKSFSFRHTTETHTFFICIRLHCYLTCLDVYFSAYDISTDTYVSVGVKRYKLTSFSVVHKFIPTSSYLSKFVHICPNGKSFAVYTLSSMEIFSFLIISNQLRKQ